MGTVTVLPQFLIQLDQAGEDTFDSVVIEYMSIVNLTCKLGSGRLVLDYCSSAVSNRGLRGNAG